MINLFIQLHEQLGNLGDRKIAFVLEGRDASGKGGFIKSLIKEDVPFTLKHQGKPTKTRNKSWLSDYAKQMPKKANSLFTIGLGILVLGCNQLWDFVLANNT